VPRQPIQDVPEPDFDDDFDSEDYEHNEINHDQRAAINTLAKQLSDLLQILETEEETPRRRW
jgi:hypothetical protein